MPAQDDRGSTHPPTIRCSYAFKYCNNPRAVKTTGELHKLCEFHRQKANLNQKRLQEKRRKEQSVKAIRTARAGQRRSHPYRLPLLLQSGLHHEQQQHKLHPATAFDRGLSFTDIDDILLDCAAVVAEPRGVTTGIESSANLLDSYEIRL